MGIWFVVSLILDKCLTMSSKIVGGGPVPFKGDSSSTISVSECPVSVSGCLSVIIGVWVLSCTKVSMDFQQKQDLKGHCQYLI